MDARRRAEGPGATGQAGAPIRRHLALAVVLVVMSILLLRDVGNPHLGYPDADRIMMDGVFIYDFLRVLPLDRVFEFAAAYYAQYPALSIGYRPPFLPLVEAGFNAVFGIHPWSSRLALLLFALVGLAAWFRLTERVFDLGTAFWASLLLATTPFVVQWGWYTMSELPVLSLALLAGYCFHRFVESDRARWAYASAAAFGLAVWTKQTAIFLGLWFVLHLLTSGRLDRLRSLHAWAALLLAAAVVVPLAVMTIWLGRQNVYQSVGTLSVESQAARLAWQQLTVLPVSLVRYHLTWPVAALAAAGMAWAVWKRDRRVLYVVWLLVSTLVFFTYLLHKDPRLSLFWIPGFAVFAALALVRLGGRSPAWRRVAAGAGALIVAYQISLVYAKEPTYATGYPEAAAYVVRHARGPAILFDGYNNGYFIYFVRALEPERPLMVLRGDKVLTSSSVFPHAILTVHTTSREGIRRLLDDYGVTHVVVERRDESGIEIHRELRALLESEPFRLVHEIPVASNRDPLKDQTLRIYEYLEAKSPTAAVLELELPIVGQTLRVPLRGGRLPPPTGGPR